MPTRKVTRNHRTPSRDEKAIYAKSRRDFSAADLQKYTKDEPGIPLASVIQEMQQIQRQARARKV
jgi:hypothetical protein